MTLVHFREILRYVPAYRGETFVIGVDGEVVDDDNLVNLMLDVGVLRSLNINVIVVHGISAQLRAHAAELGAQLSNDDGSGVTDDITMKLAQHASSETSQSILGAFSAASLPAVAPNAVVARPAGVLNGVDMLNTGKVLRIDATMLQGQMDQQVIPVLPPLGFDHQGRALRLTSDSLAVAVGVAVKARKVIFAGAVDGITADQQLIRQLNVEQAEKTLASDGSQMPAGMQSKLKNGIRGCRDGVERIHVINGRTPEGLLAEVFSNDGIGTLIYSNDYQVVRRATPDDIAFIYSLVSDAALDDEVIARSHDEISQQISDHFIAEIDGNPVACAAMFVYGQNNSAEIASLAVAEGHRNSGLALRLINYIEDEARRQSIETLLCLSTQAFSYFNRKAGFEEGAAEDLPTDRRTRWADNGRNSRILKKTIHQS